MKMYTSQEVMQVFRIEIEKFGMQKICLIPVLVEGMEPKVWAMREAQNLDEPIVELGSQNLSIWVPERCLAELDEQVIVRDRRGFKAGAMMQSSNPQATLFVEKNKYDR